MIYKVKKEHFIKNDTWKNNDWYKCPNCGYDSLDVGFHYCPNCGEGLDWDID